MIATHLPNNQSNHLNLLSTQRTIAIMRCNPSMKKLLALTPSQKKILERRPTKKTSDNWWASERTSLSYLIHRMKMTKTMKANREDIKNLSIISKMRTELWTHLKLSWKASALWLKEWTKEWEVTWEWLERLLFQRNMVLIVRNMRVNNRLLKSKDWDGCQIIQSTN